MPCLFIFRSTVTVDYKYLRRLGHLLARGEDKLLDKLVILRIDIETLGGCDDELKFCAADTVVVRAAVFEKLHKHNYLLVECELHPDVKADLDDSYRDR